MNSSCILVVPALFIVFGVLVIYFKLGEINDTLKGLPGWKEYKSPEPEKINMEHLSAHLPKK